MRVLIAGGTGFLGSHLAAGLSAAGHEIVVLTRRRPRTSNEMRWDGRTVGQWAKLLEEVDAVVNTTGYGLEHWPWNRAQKQRFEDSRVQPGLALARGIAAAERRPKVFLQISGINYYGSIGAGIADESFPAAADFLAQLAVRWEAATQPIEALGVRHVVARCAVILDAKGGLFPLMVLPVRLFAGGPFGNGQQAVPWIHVEDAVGALQFLLGNSQADGAFNLIAPQATNNTEFMRAAAAALGRPFWFRTPAFLLRAVLGEMSTLILDGRLARPRRLEESGFKFKYPTVESALANLLHKS